MSLYVLAADLGGTNLRMAVVKPDGRILHRERCPTPRDGDAGVIVSAIVELVDRCKRAAGPETFIAGLAAPLIMNLSVGKVGISPNLSMLDGFPLQSEVEKAIGVTTILENDATAAAIGESWLGASRGAQNSICITLGTGVGGGLILNGGPYRGADGTAGEIGHMVVEPEGHSCGCGSRGCLEQYASATAVVRMTKEMAADMDSIFSGAASFTAEEVYAASTNGDPVAINVYRRMGYYLGIALTGLVNVLDPDVIVLAGGLAAGWDAFAPAAGEQIEKRAFRVPADRVKLVRAELGDDAGLLGVAKVAFSSIVQGQLGV
jgi:glucokinase